MVNHYDTLGIPKNADAAAVKAAFQARMKALDEAGVTGDMREAKEKQLQQAFVTLFNPAAKARYDRQLAVSAAVRPVPPPRAKPQSFLVMVGAIVAVAAAFAVTWHIAHPSEEKLEQQRKERQALERARNRVNLGPRMPSTPPPREATKK